MNHINHQVYILIINKIKNKKNPLIGMDFFLSPQPKSFFFLLNTFIHFLIYDTRDNREAIQFLLAHNKDDI